MNSNINNRIMVSVCCLAYNHEKYLRDALEGFVNQKTDFFYEVLIHDDASTDNTARIIKEYANKYPDKIKGIFQNENQYSQGVDVLGKYVYPRAKGRYIALCEGDDYWTDQNKLQMQFNALENHPESDMCAHRAEWYNCLKEEIIRIFPDIDDNRILSVEEVIYGEGGFLPTASLFFRKEIVLDPMPFQKTWNIDYSLQIRGALRGGIVFVAKTMALYRFYTVGSWSSKKNDKTVLETLNNKRKEMLNELNKDTDELYKEVIDKRLRKNEFNKLIKENNFSQAIGKEYKVYIAEMSISKRIKLYFKAFFSRLTSMH